MRAPEASTIIPTFEAGYKLVYEPRSALLHSHERRALYDLRRHYAGGLIEHYGTLPKSRKGC